MGDLHQALLGFVRASALYDGIGVVVRAHAAVTALLHRRRGNEESEVDEESSGLPLVLVAAVKGLGKIALVLSKGCSTSWSHSLEKFGATKIDELQKSLEVEPRDPREMVPKRYRGNPQSPAEELLTATLNLCTGAFEQCRRGVGPRRFESASGDAITPSGRRSFRGSPRLLLLESTQGTDGHQIVEISQSGLLLASSLATEDSILGTVKRRAELVFLMEDRTSPLFRDGEVASRRL